MQQFDGSSGWTCATPPTWPAPSDRLGFGTILAARSFNRMFLQQCEEHPQTAILFLQSTNAIVAVSMWIAA